jgi:ribosome maturation factor RimP
LFVTGDELQTLLEPTIERLGYELVDLDARLGGKGGLLRLTIDKAGGIDLDDCEQTSHAVSALLDVEDRVAGSYNLEVSSPGLDRKLTKVAHYQRFEGEIVKVTMRFPLAGRRRFRGKLVSSNEKNIVVEVDGESHSLALAMIDTVRLVPDAA